MSDDARMSRRSALLGFSALGATGLTTGLVLPGDLSYADPLDTEDITASGSTYNMFRGTGSYPNEGNYSNGPELVTYSSNGGIRGGLWVHNSDAGSVENGSYSDPFHRGDWGHNVRRVRVKSRRSFRQPMAVVVKGKTIWYDPKGGQTIDGVRRSTNGGLKIHVGHHSNDYNYVIHLIRESGHIKVAREYHSYKSLGRVYYPTERGKVRTFKITWINNRIKVYHRRSSNPYDNSRDHLLLSVYAPGYVGGVRYNNRPIGMYLDGAAVRMYDCHVWQG